MYNSDLLRCLYRFKQLLSVFRCYLVCFKVASLISPYFVVSFAF